MKKFFVLNALIIGLVMMCMHALQGSGTFQNETSGQAPFHFDQSTSTFKTSPFDFAVARQIDGEIVLRLPEVKRTCEKRLPTDPVISQFSLRPVVKTLIRPRIRGWFTTEVIPFPFHSFW